MIETLVNWALAAAALMVTARIVTGFRVRSFWAALLAALVIGLVNAVLRPIAIFLTLPINLLTLGLFTLVIGAAMLKLAAAIVPDFEIEGWWPAIVGAVVLALINILVVALF